jgi:hypothetical protein
VCAPGCAGRYIGHSAPEGLTGCRMTDVSAGGTLESVHWVCCGAIWSDTAVRQHLGARPGADWPIHRPRLGVRHVGRRGELARYAAHGSLARSRPATRPNMPPTGQTGAFWRSGRAIGHRFILPAGRWPSGGLRVCHLPVRCMIWRVGDGRAPVVRSWDERPRSGRSGLLPGRPARLTPHAWPTVVMAWDVRPGGVRSSHPEATGAQAHA